VRAFNDGTQDVWVAKVDLTVLPPPGAATLISPLTPISTPTPTYIWSKVANATFYRLWMKNSAGTWLAQNLYAAANICGVKNCAVTLSMSLPNGIYTWYIQTLTTSQNGVWTGHSFTVAVVTPKPAAATLVAPKGTIHTYYPTFIWSKVANSTYYRLWVKNSTGTWVVQKLLAGANVCGASTCALVSPSALTNGTYTWFIQTLTATVNGSWSGQPITVFVTGDEDSVKK
jgi:hypothetical protein